MTAKPSSPATAQAANHGSRLPALNLPAAAGCTFAVLLTLFLASAAAHAQTPQPRDSIPSLGYYAAKETLYGGQYRTALRLFGREARGAVKTIESSWIDSICYRTMVGECHYHLGEYQQAVANYNAALKLYSAFSGWLLRVQFPPRIVADTQRARRPVPWGRSSRNFILGRFRDHMPIQQGRLNNVQQIQQGGVVQHPVVLPIDVQEIVHCTVLALRRRRELMGPVSQYDPLSAELKAKLTTRPGPPNHWSGAWIDLQLGLAQATTGDFAQAKKNLERSIVAGGQFDHPLSCVAMLELGRLAIESGELDAAARWLEEAGYSAFYFDKSGVLEEAFRLGQRAHLMSNQQNVYPPLAAAVRWAPARRARQLLVSLTALEAENLAVLNQSQGAAAALAGASGLTSRTDIPSGPVGAHLNYVTALVNFQTDRPEKARQALAAAIATQRRASKWIYRISLVDDLYTARSITPRVAVKLYETLLRDPAPADWSSEPLEALSVLAVPHPRSFEHWFDAALKHNREDIDAALEIADRARRHQFYSSLPLFGRLLALRRILELPDKQLPQNGALQQQDLLVRFPAYRQLAQQAEHIQRSLRDGPLLEEPGEARDKQARQLAELTGIARQQETLLHVMALRREPADLVFPPLRTTDEVRKALPPGHAVLVFFQTSDALHAFVITRLQEEYAHWKILAPKKLHQQLARLLREIGNYSQNHELSLAQLQSDKWKTAAAEVVKRLFEGSKVDLSRGVEELVIVPDGALWYLPFEALPLGGKDGPPMLARVRVRYVPTLSLAAPQTVSRRHHARTAVVVGKLFPSDKPQVAAEAFEQLQLSLPGAFPVTAPLPAPSPVVGSLVGRLIVLDDVNVDPSAPYAWSPIALDRSKSGGALAQWFPLPWGMPEEILLPGFHTVAEHSLKRRANLAPGSEVFLSVCGLMSGGAQTVLLSRWRTGGQTSFELIREFAQELPHTRATNAWQRSVQLAMDRPLNADLEPRLKRIVTDTPPPATHPFFWSGYLLVDTAAPPPDQNQPPNQPGG